jgi:hypothetical protein
MPTPERFLSLLKEKQTDHAIGSLNPGRGDQTEFSYGKACGILEGLKLAEQIYVDQTAQDEKEIGSFSRQQKR